MMTEYMDVPAVPNWWGFDTIEYTYDRESDVLNIGSLGFKPAWWLDTLVDLEMNQLYEQLIAEEEMRDDINCYIERRCAAR